MFRVGGLLKRLSNINRHWVLCLNCWPQSDFWSLVSFDFLEIILTWPDSIFILVAPPSQSFAFFSFYKLSFVDNWQCFFFFFFSFWLIISLYKGYNSGTAKWKKRCIGWGIGVGGLTQNFHALPRTYRLPFSQHVNVFTSLEASPVSTFFSLILCDDIFLLLFSPID